MGRTAEQQAEREAFLAARKKGIGGSDIASLMNVGYGCARRLWYDKRDVVPDFPPEDNPAMKLGRHMESFFADLYAEKTGYSVVEMKGPVVHPVFKELRPNIDREVMPWKDCGSLETPWVAEIKALGRAMFDKVKREGLPEDYIFQLHFGMACRGSQKGVFIIGCRDDARLLYWEVDLDEGLADRIIEEARAFWQRVLNGEAPDRLEPDDSRCQKCSYRTSCQGNALIQIAERDDSVQHDDSLLPLIKELKERKKLLEEAEKLVDETSETLKASLGDRQAVIVDGLPVYYRPQISKRGDFKAIQAGYDGLRELVLTHTESQPEMHLALQKAYPPSDSFKKDSVSRPLRIY